MITVTSFHKPLVLDQHLKNFPPVVLLLLILRLVLFLLMFLLREYVIALDIALDVALDFTVVLVPGC